MVVVVDDIYERLERASEYALGPRGSEGLLERTRRQQAAIEASRASIEAANLDSDHRVKIEARLELLERELEKDNVELEYWQKVLERSEQGHFDEGRMATDEGVEVLERKGEESKEQSLRVNDLTTDAEGPLQATTSIRQRTRPASAWHVKPDNSNHSDNPGNLDNTTLTSQSRRREHDVLLDDLVHMATRLKERNYALQLHVSKDKTIDTADLALSTNAARFHTQHGELKQFTRKSWATLWRLIILMLLVVVSMLVMFMLIVVTKK